MLKKRTAPRELALGFGGKHSAGRHNCRRPVQRQGAQEWLHHWTVMGMTKTAMASVTVAGEVGEEN